MHWGMERSVRIEFRGSFLSQLIRRPTEAVVSG